MLGSIIAALTLAHGLVVVARFGFGRDHLLGLSRLFDLNIESNVPTWYSSAALVSCALALALTGELKRQTGDRFAKHWFGLALLFAYMSRTEVEITWDSQSS